MYSQDQITDFQPSGIVNYKGMQKSDFWETLYLGTVIIGDAVAMISAVP